MGLYEELVEAGVETDSHESDLYFPATQQAMSILRKYETHTANAVYFTHAINGEHWADVPFAFTPWWTKRLEKKS